MKLHQGTGCAKPVDAVIFDMDGVVTNLAQAHAAAWKRMFDEYLEKRSRKLGEHYEPFDPEKDYLIHIDGRPRYEGARNFLESRGIPLPSGSSDDPPGRETVCGLGNLKNEHFLEHLKKHGAHPYRSTVDCVRGLKSAGVRVAVVSAGRNARAVLEAAGVHDLFDASVDGMDSTRLGLKGKPSPDIFLEAARRLGTSPGRTAVVEDALAGVEAAKVGGFALVVGVDRAGQGDELRKRGADIVVDDLSRLDETGIDWCLGKARLRSAIGSIHEILARLGQGRPAIFLDYDGTLTPIVQEPAQAVLPQRTKIAVKRLAEYWPVAILSGRAVSDVRDKVGLDNVIYAGSHGFGIEGPGEAFDACRWRHLKPVFDEAAASLEKAVQHIRGVHLELKPYDIAVHYRLADESDVPGIERLVDETAGRLPGLRKTLGKKVFELRPDVDWDKGKALLHICEILRRDGPPLTPVFIGDDVTDEDALKAVAGQGVGILVSEEDRPTHAEYVLRDPSGTALFLERLAAFAARLNPRDVHTLAYKGFDPAEE